MKEKRKIFLGDLVIILFLVYMYLWRIGPLYSMLRIALSAYFILISVIFYLLLFKFSRLNHWAVLLGTLVFSFCGSDLSLISNFNKIPYPGTLPFFIGCFSFCAIKKRRRYIYIFTIITFLLASISIIMHFPVILESSMRLFFNLLFGLIVAYGLNSILDPISSEGIHFCYKRVQKLFYNVWLCVLLIFLPIAYALLVTFIGLGKQLIPNIVSYLVMFEIFLGWALIISYRKHKAISNIAPFITIFLCAADIFTYWTVIGCRGGN